MKSFIVNVVDAACCDEISVTIKADSIQRIERVLSNLNNACETAEKIMGKAETSKALTVDDIGLSVRARNVLVRAGVKTVDELLICPESKLIRMRNMGRHTLEEIKEKVREYYPDWLKGEGNEC